MTDRRTPLAVALLLTAPSASGLTWDPAHPTPMITHFTDEREGDAVVVHPFGTPGQGPELPRGFALYNRGQWSFEDAVRHFLREKLTTPLLQVRSTPSPSSLTLTDGGKSTDYRFFVQGIPLCHYQLRAHQLADGAPFVLGTLPLIDPAEPAPAADWPDPAIARELAATAVHQLSGADSVTTGSISRCFHVAAGDLLPVWRVTITAGGLPYVALADAYQAVEAERQFFDVDGMGLIYPANELTGHPAEVTLTGLTGDGTLTGQYLQTVVPPGYPRAQQPDERFDFTPGDPRFAEVEAYAHAQNQLAWFEQLGFRWYGPSPLLLMLHVPPRGHPNNALFTPGSDVDGTQPSIAIDDGDGSTLRNLVTDSDVVSHELGHHIIYRTLKSTWGESLVLHEGLADSFVFLHKGDPCLGPSICPAGSPACVMEGQCLRNATVPLVYDDDTWRAWAGPNHELGHLHGQLVSGLLWDLRKSGVLPPDDVTRLTFKAVSYFKEDSGLRDFVLSLLAANRELFGCQYDQALRDAAEARGLGAMIADVPPGCNALPLTTGASEAATPLATSPAKSSTGNAPTALACGTIAVDGHQTRLAWLALLVAAPLLLPLTQTRARARASRPGVHPPSGKETC